MNDNLNIQKFYKSNIKKSNVKKSQTTITKIIIRKMLEILQKLPKCDTETYNEQKLLGENGTNQLAWHKFPQTFSLETNNICKV